MYIKFQVFESLTWHESFPDMIILSGEHPPASIEHFSKSIPVVRVPIETCLPKAQFLHLCDVYGIGVWLNPVGGGEC